MTWRDTIKSQSDGGVPLRGRFRNARFIVPESDARVGRRNEVHEYPLRDKPWVEDTGRATRQFTVPVFVDSTLGDHLQARNALIAALEAEGPGTLVHPWFGTMTVSLAEPASVSDSTRDGGRTSFRITFVEAGELTFPNSGTDTPSLVDARASAALEASSGSFLDTWSAAGLPDWSLAELSADTANTLSELEAMAEGITNRVTSELRAPGTMVAALFDALQSIGDIASEPLRALQLYRRLFESGSSTSAPQTGTSTRRQQAINSAAFTHLVQQSAVIEASRASSQVQFQTRDDALDTALVLQEALDVQMETVDPVTGRPVDDAVYSTLQALRAAVTEDLRVRGARLPELVEYTPLITQPALLIAHRLYGDAARADEITVRNRIKHPGFVTGGDVLEVLNG